MAWSKNQPQTENKTTQDQEDENIDISKIDSQDFKINPAFYLHNAIVGAQAILKKGENIKESLILFRFLVEHAETIARAWNKIPKEYDELIEGYKRSTDYADATEEYIKSFRLANKKLGLLMTEIFQSQTVIDNVMI